MSIIENTLCVGNNHTMQLIIIIMYESCCDYINAFIKLEYLQSNKSLLIYEQNKVDQFSSQSVSVC
jgi:hypothetical protein